MTIEQIIILIVIYISVVADSMRDGMMKELYIKISGKWTKKQWRWHGCKWVSMFSLWTFMSFKFFDGNYNINNIVIFIAFALFCRWSWKLIYIGKIK